MPPFNISCQTCGKQFRTTHSLKKHWLQKHPRINRPKVFSVTADAREVDIPQPERMSKRSLIYKNYMLWLDTVVERINNTLHPKAPAKWNKIELLHVPVEYLKQLLADIGDIEVNAVKEVTHWRPPIMCSSATKITYRTYNLERVEGTFSTKNVPLRKSCNWSGHEELEDTEMPEILTAEDAIQVAMTRGKRKRMTCSSELKIDQDKPTREYDLIWWSDLYKTQGYGKLCLRFYVGKVVFE
ncbi:uncharacterized protein LOC116307494 [Actinia tenebrosa]|uniref:Uncharacterized protein LOC116307494 n=1 Tax=Actinia tenebrosa TaxID=6105 RepID=A0A6P8J1Z8_ACTTE|nr:uncharacterized protein LOC116307494 [Actinia tenebrosa]